MHDVHSQSYLSLELVESLRAIFLVLFFEELLVDHFDFALYLILDVLFLELEIVYFGLFGLLVRGDDLLDLQLLVFAFLNGKLHSDVLSTVFFEIDMGLGCIFGEILYDLLIFCLF